MSRPQDARDDHVGDSPTATESTTVATPAARGSSGPANVSRTSFLLVDTHTADVQQQQWQQQQQQPQQHGMLAGDTSSDSEGEEEEEEEEGGEE